MNIYKYLQSYENYFWHWTDEGEIVEICDGSTLAYQKTIADVISHFENQALPSFGSLLLAIIATNPSHEIHINTVREAVTQRTFNIGKNKLHLVDVLKKAIQLMKVLGDLPSKYKTGSNRGLVFRLIFENSHNCISLKDSTSIIGQLINGDFGTANWSDQRSNLGNPFLSDFKPLAVIYKRYSSVDQIISALERMPEIQESLELDEGVDLKEQNNRLSFIDELKNDQKTYQIGNLIDNIWSGLRIPYHLHFPSDQSMGGVSGLSNKGTFDKLLLSEFANDDLVLLSRLANNESLYVKQEVSTDQKDNKRILLIDLSIKNWGIPRLLAYAVAVAISNHPKNKIECEVYGIGEKIYPLDLHSTESVIESLRCLDPSLNCAIGLEQFLNSEFNHKKSEVFLIASEESIQQPETLKVLNDNFHIINFWVNVDRLGGIQLYKNLFRSKRLIQELQLPLDQLWAKKKAVRYSNDKPIKKHLYPLLFPRSNNFMALFATDDGRKFIISKNKKLFVSEDSDKGDFLVCDLPFVNKSCKFELGKNTAGEPQLLVYTPGTKQVWFVNLNENEIEIEKAHFQPWKGGEYPEFIFFKEAFYYCNRFNHWKVTCDTKVNIEKPEIGQDDVLKAYADRIKERAKYVVHVQSLIVLKKIKSLFINNVGNLVFSIHELIVKNDHLRLSQTAFLSSSAKAAMKDKEGRYFEFEEGSTIRLDTSGMLIFESSDSTIDVFYIPSVLVSSLAIGSKDFFSGNEHYALTGENELPRTKMAVAYKNYLEAFIQNILSNAVKN